MLHDVGNSLAVIGLLERHHDAQPGMPRRAVTAYARALESRRDYSFDAGSFMDEVDERLTDAETWEGPDRFYELDGDRISVFPARWHEELSGSTDAAEYLRFIDEHIPELGEKPENLGASVTVPRDRLVEIIRILAGLIATGRPPR